MDQAIPELVVASALKPKDWRASAEPTSQGLGSTKQPAWCNSRNWRRFCSTVTLMLCSLTQSSGSFAPNWPRQKIHKGLSNGAKERRAHRVAVGRTVTASDRGALVREQKRRWIGAFSNPAPC